MRVAAVINFKGGTGKTTTALNLGAGLALRGHTVLLVDADPQAGLTVSLNTRGGCSLRQLISQQRTWPQCCTPVSPRLNLIPSDIELEHANIDLVRHYQTSRHILSQRLQELNGYNFILFDCAPSLSILNENVLTYAQEIIIPVAMDYLAVAGLLQVYHKLQDLNPAAMQQLVIVPTFFDQRQRKSKETLRLLMQQFGAAVTQPVRANVQLSEAAAAHRLIYTYAPRSYGAQDYARLVERIAQHRKPGAHPPSAASPAERHP